MLNSELLLRGQYALLTSTSPLDLLGTAKP